MSEVITLQASGMTAAVDTQGAWLTRLELGGLPLLFPKQTFELPDGSEKVRGGCHVCLPNFGPGGDSGLPQHGFARDDEWTCMKQAVDAVELELLQASGDYAGLLAGLRYELTADGITMTLTAENRGNTKLRLSPGFHPYFPRSGASVSIDDTVYDLVELHEARVLSAVPNRLEADSRSYELNANGLGTWIAWTDQLGHYVCVEPTAGGFSFLERSREDQFLQPGAGQSWSLSIRTKYVA